MPVLQKGTLEVVNHRPPDTEVHVVNSLGRRSAGGLVPAADVHAAGVGFAAVDDQKFAVIAQIDVGAVAQGKVAFQLHP